MLPGLGALQTRRRGRPLTPAHAAAQRTLLRAVARNLFLLRFSSGGTWEGKRGRRRQGGGGGRPEAREHFRARTALLPPRRARSSLDPGDLRRKEVEKG